MNRLTHAARRLGMTQSASFGFGARSHVNHLLGVRDMRERYRQGDAIRIGSIEGRIISLGGRVVALETEEGQVAVPGK